MQIIPIKNSEKLEILYGVGDSEFGLCFIAWTGQGVCFLGFGNEQITPNIIAEMKNLWQKSSFQEESAQAKKLITAIFKEENQPDLIVAGTDFQIKVWKALLKIKSGTTMSYESFAKQVGGINYTRAAASAIAKNNISYLIPCHRVIHKSGNINKYRWGSEIKTKLLNWELKK